MKNTLKIMITAITMSLFISTLTFAFGEGRVASVVDGDFQRKYSAAYFYVDENGNYVKNEWKYCGDEWYYFGDKGESLRLTWFKDSDGKWYYFDNFSIMLHDTTIDGHKLGSDGVWIPADGEAVPVQEIATNN
ncbi:MAG: hypothetical protein E7251_01195 [Paenibacillaceae bacterium]|nr:hypothetical protein [Paenibacillaceae bacterium]